MRPQLRAYQAEAVSAVLDGFKKHQRLLIVAATGAGKCLGPGTPVLKFNGDVVPVEQVKDGDLLMGPDSKPRRVLSTTHGNGPMFRIEPVKGEPWTCNWCHVLTLKHTETGKVIDIPLDEYATTNKNFKHLHKQFSVGVDFWPRPTPRLDPYIFGLWLGDGSKDLKSFAITKPDPEIGDALESFAKQWGAEAIRRQYGDKCPTWFVSRGRVGRGGFPLLDLMRELFKNQDIPKEFLVASRVERLELLAGLLDSDGYMSSGGFEIAQKNPRIADGVCFVARSLGFKVVRKQKTVNGTVYQRMTLSGDLSLVPNRIPRKKAPPREINKDACRTGFSVHPLGNGDYYGFQLDGDGRFLLGDFTVTHNTQIFSEIANHFLPGRVLVLAHRKELVQQAADRLQLVTGEIPDIEMAELWASNRARVVCASLQSIAMRLERWPSDHFDLVIGDEFHHFVSKSYKKVWDHFTCKKLGVTATPDRGDERALGQIVDDVAYTFDILDGIDQGYLVPIKGRSVEVSEVDLSHISKTAGDLAMGELDEEMAKHIEGIVQKTLELEPDKQGIWFFPGVKSAELACDRINALGKSCAFVCGETPKEERDIIMKGFKNGTFSHLTNCAVATEGFDAPNADMVVIGRPTLSRALYAQMVGRGLRVLPGTVDGVEGGGDGAQRRALVAASAKPHCTVVDFAGNAGRHTLITPEDLLGGKYTEEEVKLAKEKAAKDPLGGDVLEKLDQARRELKAAMAKLKSKVQATVVEFSPFSVLNMEPPDKSKEAYREPMTPEQKSQLKAHNIKDNQMAGLSRLEAQKLLQSLNTRRRFGLASLNQINVLKRHGVDSVNIPFKVATKAIDYIASTGWRPDPNVLKEMVTKR